MPLQASQKRQVVAVTGGIGSGKSKVCAHIASVCRFPVVDLDIICSELLAVGASGWHGLRKVIDSEFFESSGALDRCRFRTALFNNNNLRSKVNGVLHPLARRKMMVEISRLRGSVLVEIPLLFEVGWQEDFNIVIVVYADSDVCRKRIILRDSVSESQAGKAMASQMSLAAKAKLADVVIDNSGNWQETTRQVEKIANCLCGNDVF